ncbi:MAG: FAD-dependent oxidoreductase, partial [Comamonas sp.]
MGKTTGFMEYERIEEGYAPVAERLKNYKEFVIGLTTDQAKVQAARCMDCGTPFCNNGCPVNNIIPDFNDLVYRGDWENAIKVLHSTNNFPEFTGRICPAPCEAACVANINGDAIGIKSIEHAIIDRAWDEGWVKAQKPKLQTGKKVAVVGAGPAGLAAALAAARSGARVIIADEQEEFGGSLLDSRENLDGKPATEWVASVIAELKALPDVVLLPRATVNGYHDHNFLT